MIEDKIDLNNLPFTQMSSGFLMGLSVGYFFKKGFKIMLFVLGLVTVAIFWFNSQDLITVNGEKIINIFDILSEVLKNSYNFVYNKLTQFKPVTGVSVIVGFFAGLKLG
jgi:uncharacterized membrane protein (Fun14 family)